MRLDFNVLWVDDQPDSVAAQITSIESKMATEGFEFKPRRCTTIDDLDNAISEDVFTDEVDLILVDWDLGNGMHGEDAIERIRRIVQYKDVVFYSGQASVVELRQKVFERQLEGVYCASRIDLVEEVVGVFESLIKKILDLDHTRGIVMGATSDIDYMVNTCLTLAHNKLDKNGKDLFNKEVLKRVDDQLKNLNKQGKKIQEALDLECLFRAHLLFTSDHRLRLLEKVLGMDVFKEHSEKAPVIQSYRNAVVRERNNLGHAVLVPQGKPNSVIDEAGKVVSIEEMRELRKRILNLRVEFRALLHAMQA